MSTQENKELIKRYFNELINKKNNDIIEELVADDFVDHQAPDNVPHGPVGVRKLIGKLFDHYSQLKVEVDDIIAEDNKVVVRNTWQGTLRNTDTYTVMQGVVIYRIENGKIKERWASVDKLAG